MDSPPFLSGKLLLAMPGMADPRFDRAVIAMAVHDENGAVGIGIGQLRAGIRFRSLLKQLDVDPGSAPDCAVHHGGPVRCRVAHRRRRVVTTVGSRGAS